MKKILLPILFSILLVAGIISCRRDTYHTMEGGVWNTTYRIIYKSPRSLDDSVIAVMRHVELSLSPFNDSSIISRINRNDPVIADSLVVRVFGASKEINRRSSGAFDPTVAPLVNAWGFGYKNGTGDPSARVIDSLLAFVGIDSCFIKDGMVVKKHPSTEFNFSAITKGFGCDMVAEMFRRNGVTDYLVEIGGEIALSGVNSRGDEWRIMVDMPDTAALHSELTVITPGSGGVATSGNYRNFRVTDSGTVWHTINPVTGRPAPAHILSATVLAPDVMIADAVATSCMAMNPDSAMTMVEDFPGVEVLLVMPDNSLRYSSGFPSR